MLRADVMAAIYTMGGKLLVLEYILVSDPRVRICHQSVMGPTDPEHSDVLYSFIHAICMYLPPRCPAQCCRLQ